MVIEKIKRNGKNIVPDTSVLINRKLSELIESGKLDNIKIIIPRFVVDELQAQASRGKDVGFKGLEEIKKIRSLAEKSRIKLLFDGRRPTLEEINLAKKGRIDALIRDFAVKENATLLTSDYVQALVGEAEGVSVAYSAGEDLTHKKIALEGFFDKDIQSVHLKVGVRPYAKVGMPGEVKLRYLREKPVSEDEFKLIMNEIMGKSRRDPSSFIEISKIGAMVIQMGQYRISITKPPFSSASEITAVKPLIKMKLADYKLHKQLEESIVSGSQGILIAGPPGSGKSTFAASIANYLSENGNIVKTFEQPRDLQVNKEVTQYAPLEDDWEKTAELLLLVRPDYTIFDEVRRTKDFRVFADMRLAGVGMIGVIHSTDPVSAIQRFVGRIELGMIPHVIDTVIYIYAGKVQKTYSVSMTVKVPTGMTEQDLARPIVEIRDHETKRLEYEIYSYGEENVVIPISGEAKTESPLRRLAAKTIMQELRHYGDDISIDFVSDGRITLKVRNEVIPRIIGKKGKTIEEIEKRLGVKISVEPMDPTTKAEEEYHVREKGANIILQMSHAFGGKQIDLYDGKEYIISPMISPSGTVKFRKHSMEGRKVVAAIMKKTLRVLA